ncbi:MAG: hypothetical protein ACD_10C00212G0001 [uncultured bacterium]|nr:MAG: hypothetical protein ACD_10C00212G0001 [uncultured bacterium]
MIDDRPLRDDEQQRHDDVGQCRSGHGLIQEADLFGKDGHLLIGFNLWRVGCRYPVHARCH